MKRKLLKVSLIVTVIAAVGGLARVYLAYQDYKAAEEALSSLD